MKKLFRNLGALMFAFVLAITLVSIPAKAATTKQSNTSIKENQMNITVGTDEEGNTTVTYGKYTFTRKYNGWYIPAAYIYSGSDLANFLDKAVRRTRRTSVRCDGFLFIKVSGGWYRHELHINDGRTLATIFNKAAGITSTYDPNNLNSDDANSTNGTNGTNNNTSTNNGRN
ncbi:MULTISPECIES: hypothetical protein [unclassified Butyrivibrio]|uniref:hypothetical protein n=1 Tax=unclassified Butyrivibrio TaxID=2639466 RepID=UPI0003B6431E|nr:MULTISPECIES: hypothetical protein [unclassified Butyrivibrio]